jgi:hypothetical protein
MKPVAAVASPHKTALAVVGAILAGGCLAVRCTEGRRQ